MPDRRGAVASTLLLLLVVAGVGFAAGVRYDHRPVEIPAKVAIDSMHLVALEAVHARDSTTALLKNDSAVAAIAALEHGADTSDATSRSQLAAADSIRRGRPLPPTPEVSVGAQLEYWKSVSYSFNAETIELRLAIHSDSVTVAN